MKKKILFIVGSINQSTQMHQISQELPEYDCYFSQIFADAPLITFTLKYTTLADSTIFGGQFRINSEKYLRQHNLPIDYKAEQNKYDLVVYCSDMVVPPRMRHTKTLWVQEGMIDPYTRWSNVVKKLNLPAYFSGNTSLNGSSNVCDVYCAASEGYKNYISMRGTERSKIFVTGIPNFDNIATHLVNDFPHRDYVMVATTDMRETYRKDDRVAFVRRCVEIANGRTLLFKLHPNENIERAVPEIRQNTPENTMVYWTGNTNDMIANSQELITQYSTVVYVGIALGKKVHSYFDLEELYSQTPLQNEGTSAKNIAHICRNFIEFEGKKEDFAQNFMYESYAERLKSGKIVPATRQNTMATFTKK